MGTARKTGSASVCVCKKASCFLVPASYMVEREISNVWNKIVLDGENARSALDDAVIIMNQEHQRKLEEFGYLNNGEFVKPYRIATIELIESWIGVDDE